MAKIAFLRSPEWGLYVPLILGASGCGGGTVGVFAAAASGGSGNVDDPTQIHGVTVVEGRESPAVIEFRLSDPEGDPADVVMLYERLPGSGKRPMTLVGDSNLARLETSAEGVDHTRLWDFATDLGTTTLQVGVRYFIGVIGGVQLEGPSASFGNDPPEILQAIVLDEDGAEELEGDVGVRIVLRDSSADLVDVRIEFAEAGSSVFRLARSAGTPTSRVKKLAFEGLATTDDPAGEAIDFNWDSDYEAPEGLAPEETQLHGRDLSVALRVTVIDSLAESTLTLPAFHLDNNAPPRAILDGWVFSAGIKERGGIPIPFELVDDESDEVGVAVQWRAQGESFAELPPPSELRDLLVDPARAAERRELHLAEQAPLAFTGHVGFRASLPSNRVRLPELAADAAGALACDLSGRTVELLRSTRTPERVTWESATLAGPVASLVPGDGGSALVLDHSLGGWRLREIDLESGAEIRSVATGSGAPKALAVDPAREHLFVASDEKLFRLHRFDGSAPVELEHHFSEGPCGLAALGSSVVVATGDRVLRSFDLDAGRQTVLLRGLTDPSGVAVDPLDEGRLYLAETGRDRLLALDLDERVPIEIAARVADEDVSELGTIPFPSPRSLVIEDDGRQLLVMCQQGGKASLRRLHLRSPVDLDGPPDGRADPFVREVTGELGDPRATLAAGSDHLRIVCLPDEDRLAIGGGVAQSGRVLWGPSEGAVPYDPQTQVVTLVTGLDPYPDPGTPWRIAVPVPVVEAPSGRSYVYVWDSADVPDAGAVQVRVVPLDQDLGLAEGVGGFRPYRADFEPRVLGTAQLQTPEHAVAADLDGDGDLDLATANQGKLVLLLQVAPGTFEPAAEPVLASGGPICLVATDLNGDGLRDLVSACAMSNELKLFLQQEAPPGHFVPYRTLQTGDCPVSLVAADLDRDGRVDLVSANRESDDLSLFYQTATGTFLDQPDLTLGAGEGSEPWCVAAADLDGDNFLDLVVTANDPGQSTEPTGKLRLFFQESLGSFTLKDAVEVGCLPRAVVAADLDGDGDLDLAAVSGDNRLDLHFQTAPGAFEESASLETLRPRSVAAADLDGDGDTDLVSVGEVSDELRLFFQTAPGGFTPARHPMHVSDGQTLAESPVCVVASDLNGDGLVDLASVNRISDNLTLFLQNAPAVLRPAAEPLPASTWTRTVATADLDGDGDVDLVAQNAFCQELLLYHQTAPGVFTAAGSSLQTGETPLSVAAADLDGDGDVDLVSADRHGGGLTLFLRGEGPNDGFKSAELPLPGTGPGQVIAADLDGDGDTDLVSAGLDSLRHRRGLERRRAPGPRLGRWRSPPPPGLLPGRGLARDLPGRARLPALSPPGAGLRRGRGPERGRAARSRLRQSRERRPDALLPVGGGRLPVGSRRHPGARGVQRAGLGRVRGPRCRRELRSGRRLQGHEPHRGLPPGGSRGLRASGDADAASRQRAGRRRPRGPGRRRGPGPGRRRSRPGQSHDPSERELSEARPPAPSSSGEPRAHST